MTKRPQLRPTVIATPSTPGTSWKPAPSDRPNDLGRGLAFRVLVVAVLGAVIILWDGGWVPDSLGALCAIAVVLLVLVYVVTGPVRARPDPLARTAELALGALIACIVVSAFSLVIPGPSRSPDKGPSIVLTVEDVRARLADGSTTPPAGAVEGQALFVTVTTDATGVRSRAAVAIKATWEHVGGGYRLTIARGDDDATAKTATAALASAEEVWLLDGK